jgi:hypothetical protein
MTEDAGFVQDHLLVVDFDFSPLKLPPASQMAYKQALLARMQSIPGVSSAAETLVVPLNHSGWDDNIDIPNGPQRQDVTLNRVSPGYFRTMETPLLVGRDFNHTDTPNSPRVAIVNEAFTRKFLGGANALGRVFTDSGKPDQTYQIVGLVKNTKYYLLREDDLPIAFVSFTQANGPEEDSKLMIRSDEPLASLIRRWFSPSACSRRKSAKGCFVSN